MKKCSSCKESKPPTEFYKNCHQKDGISTYCKKCNTLWVRKRYLSNKDYYREINDRHYKSNREFVVQFLLKNPCIDCGEKDIVVLDFDHMKGKKASISTMIRKLYCLESLKKEIEKCEVRCANCHRRRHALLNKWYKHSVQNLGHV